MVALPLIVMQCRRLHFAYFRAENFDRLSLIAKKVASIADIHTSACLLGGKVVAEIAIVQNIERSPFTCGIITMAAWTHRYMRFSEQIQHDFPFSGWISFG